MNMIKEIAIPDQMVLMIRGHSFLRVKNLLRSIHVVDTLGFRVGCSAKLLRKQCRSVLIDV